MEYKKAQPVKLREVGKDEKWLQDLINDDPAILGLGELSVYRREKIQTTKGRVDFVLADPEDDTIRYETEIMLGTLNESHIIRTIEYWDVERRKYPSLTHRAVVVAEDITNRFFNVISLMNKAIPIIAIQLNAFTYENNLFLNFVKVLDLVETSEDEDQGGQDVVDRNYWDKRANVKSMKILDILTSAVKAISEPRITYNRGHIAIGTTGRNFMWCHPRKNPYLFFELRIGEDRELIIKKFEGTEVECNQHRNPEIVNISITEKEFDENKDLIIEAIQLGEQNSHQD
ncbi:MAG: hypothetical protein IH589_05180 [Anaerolineales bacterium]|nr:hypothetical protein [Anaerolineales bacterium]